MSVTVFNAFKAQLHAGGNYWQRLTDTQVIDFSVMQDSVVKTVWMRALALTLTILLRTVVCQCERYVTPPSRHCGTKWLFV